MINKEEELLEKEKSTFPLLQTVMTNKEPYEQLWVTTYEFSTKSEEWMNGTARSPSAGAGWAPGHGPAPDGSRRRSELRILAGLCTVF